MRELKFRAWDKKTKQICPVANLSYEMNSGELISVILSECNGEFVWRDIEDVKLLQYTGLKDKKGTEIYEGDIIEEKINNNEYIICEVVNDKGAFKGKENEWEPEYLISEWTNGKVIGNIFENLELLTKEY